MFHLARSGTSLRAKCRRFADQTRTDSVCQRSEIHPRWDGKAFLRLWPAAPRAPPLAVAYTSWRFAPGLAHTPNWKTRYNPPNGIPPAPLSMLRFSDAPDRPVRFPNALSPSASPKQMHPGISPDPRRMRATRSWLLHWEWRASAETR